ncbi:MAG: prepilin-type N-terminal cleavage/methylation domain-containing protein [Pelosinus sp.]|nr:prepilin-type N-terminal cleavage/methylation domain-containing protein [Pelosinus sp.]
MERWSVRGVTLIEVLVYIVLSTVILAGISNLFAGSLHIWYNSSRQTEAQQAARMALDSMVRELRQAVRLEYDENKPHEITYIEPLEHKKVRFYEYAGFLYRDSGSSPQPVAGVERELRISCLNFCMTPDFMAVDIEIAVAWHAWNRAEQAEFLKTTVYCVNCQPEN